MSNKPSIKFDFKDNSPEVFEAFNDAVDKALEEIGLTAERYAKMNCPVDTGRLRNSISHDTDDDTAYIGTNVEYAPYVEMGTVHMRPKHYLQKAVEEHQDTYKKFIQRALKNA